MNKKIDSIYHDAFQHRLTNVTIMSIEMYCFYIVNCTTMEYIGTNYTWITIMGTKDNKQSLLMADYF